MKPVATDKTTFTYRGPTPDIGDLPCYREAGAVWSVWELTDEERRFIVDGGNIALGIWAEPIPPVALEVVGDQPAPRAEMRIVIPGTPFYAET